MTITAPSVRRKDVKRDAVLIAAVDLARAAAEEIALTGDVGDHIEAVMEADRLATHYFTCLSPGYRGWRWAVTVARAPRAKVVTVCEAELLPGSESLLAPSWVPWLDRLQPADVGRADVLPLIEDDPRLEPGYEAVDDSESDDMAVFEFGLGRQRVLSAEGRHEAATRWYDGAHGPTAPGVADARGTCSTCGFLMLMSGSMRTMFGVCANEWSPDDGQVVSMDHGCGAHSETDVPTRPTEWPDAEAVYDDASVVIVTESSAAADVDLGD